MMPLSIYGSDLMKHKRYGKFCFRDYISGWFAIAVLFLLIITCFITDTHFYLLIWPLLFLFIMVWSIYKPNSERFSISGDIIKIIQAGKEQRISIPAEPTLIVSYADVCPPLAKRISYGNQTYVLKGKYAISILQKMSLQTVLDRLHQNYTQKYTNSTVEACFEEYLYVYSFVGNQEILDELLFKRNCQIIIPETLVNQISIDLHQTNIHIDIGY